MIKKILYIGNDLVGQTNYQTAMQTLFLLLEKEEFDIKKTSNKKNKILRMLAILFTTIKEAKKVDFILIDTFSTKNFYFALVGSQIARIFNTKYIPILHGGNLPKRIKKSKKLSNLIFKNSYKNISPSNYLKYEFEKEGYQVYFIPNILEIDNYTFKNRKILQPKILWVRAFKKLYNPTLAIKVFNLVKKEFPSAELCMVGPELDNSLSKCKDLAEKLNLSNSVEFIGGLPQKEWHNKSVEFDIFINTTNVDNMPVSVLEAMALGLTVVSTNVGGLPYLINNNENGILVTPNNASEMASEIISLINNNKFELAINARELVEKFSWEFVRVKWLKILNF